MNKQFLLEKFVGRKRKRSAAVANDEKKFTSSSQERREEALAEICVTVESNEAIRQKLEVQEDLDELDELTELETELFGFIVA